ncbi:hypothetical protein C8K30_103458 [Promicromonospora sp. AC04]|uniref:hypothetical protein n=1 Tax=Promicromonospora sp. AC04 TaxID=2135723 RepID=UPI000D3633FD|nr:hypothetical protein [Promicromonospora sp. AC04]PUB29032.1 hypothetical protein C8K30_103458 [Promicromonospora sp. AC04]
MFRKPCPAALGTAVALMLTLGLSACQADESAPAVSDSTAASSSASPSPSELSPEDEAIKQAKPLVQSFFQMKDESMQAPANFKYQWFGKVAIGSAENYLKKWHGESGEQGLHQVGATELVSVEVNEVDLTFKPKVTPPEIPFVEFTVCYDVADLDVVDKDGKSVVSADRKDRGVAQLGVANYEYPDGPWLVDIIEFPEGETC